MLSTALQAIAVLLAENIAVLVLSRRKLLLGVANTHK